MAELRLVGAGREHVDFRRTIASHGVADLPPNRIDEDAWTLELTLWLAGNGPRTVRIRKDGRATRRSRRSETTPIPAPLLSAIGHVLRLDEDLSPFYEVAASDPELGWATAGAGRMIRSPTVFEEVVKTT